MSIFGTRPEAIKMAPVILELEKHENIQSLVTVTGQHRDQLDQVLSTYSISPKYDLNIMKKNQTLIDINTDILKKLDPILKEEKPDMILVHGDTSTSFVAGLCAFYNQIPIGHVEAGLRSGDKYQPYPEEINRKLLTHISDLHFAPTNLSAENLRKENIHNNIYITGNTVIDAIGKNRNNNVSSLYMSGINSDSKIVLVTAHRRENLGKPLENICDAITYLSKKYVDLVFVYPVHLNPAVRETVFKKLTNNPKIILTEPMDATTLHGLMEKSYLVLTDSGGLQEEAPFFKVPVVVLRDVTERPEGLTAGVLKLAGTNKEKIISVVSELIENENTYKVMKMAKNPYGDGKASQRIVQAIKYYFQLTNIPPEKFIWQ